MENKDKPVAQSGGTHLQEIGRQLTRDYFKNNSITAWQDWAREAQRFIANALDERQRLYEHPSAQPQQEPHKDDIAIDKFAAAMKMKMAKQRKKDWFGWDTCTIDRLQSLLAGHMVKGDPIDVGNYCMMLFNRGAGTKDPMTCQPWIEAAINALNTPAQQSQAPSHNLSEDVVYKLWQESYNIALSDAGFKIGNADVAHMNQPIVFAKILLEAYKENKNEC